MAISSGNQLTRYISAVTIITADVANSWYGGLFGTSEGNLLDPSDPLVAGHVHDGAHADGHAQKIDLVNHVTGQLRNDNLADNAVNVRNIQSFLDPANAIPISEMVGGDEYFFLDLSSLDTDTPLQTAWETGNTITIPDSANAPVIITNNDASTPAPALAIAHNAADITPGIIVIASQVGGVAAQYQNIHSGNITIARLADGQTTNGAIGGSTAGYFYRDRPPAETDQAVVSIQQANASDDQAGLRVFQNNSSANAAEFIGDVDIAGKLTVSGLIDPTGLVLDHQASRPDTPTGGKAQFWARNDDTPMFTTSGGTDIDLSATGGGAFATTSNVTSNSPGDFDNDDFVFGSDSLDDDGVLTHDSRFLFDKNTGSFRAGVVQSTQWDTRGFQSTAFGLNNTASGDRSTIAGGNGSTVSVAGSFVGAGTSNVIAATAGSFTYAGILTGNANVVNQSGGVIAGGFLNSLTKTGGALYSTSNNFIGCGSNNIIDAAAADTDISVIAGGDANSIIDSTGSFIGGGSNNSITSSEHGTILGGKTQKINSGANFGTIIGGQNCSVDIEYGSAIGRYAVARNPAFTHANGRISGTDGSSQGAHFVLFKRVVAGPVNTANLYLDGIGQEVSIANLSCQRVEFYIITNVNGGAPASYSFRWYAHIVNNGGTLTYSAGPPVLPLGGTAWISSIILTTSNPNSWGVQLVTSASHATIDVVARCEMTEYITLSNIQEVGGGESLVIGPPPGGGG